MHLSRNLDSVSEFEKRHNRRATDRKTVQFRTLLHSKELEFLCEAHNGLSAKICEEAGFKGIWASGLCLSAQFGVRDSNEASWTQLLEMLEFMSDATDVPILLDGDTGYGNFNNMRRLVKKLEQRDIAAVCIEDKLFPKTNSFIASKNQPLANVDEFCGKIKAAKDAQRDDGFSVIARVEALIAGWGLREAIHRAEAYHKAGADGILMHSAKSTADEILAFKNEWGDRCPVVIVPTKYYATPTDVFREHGISIAIWANQVLRSAVRAMQKTTRRLQKEQALLSVEERIVSVGEIFRLQGADELKAAEERYLPKRAKSSRAIVLAASRGRELGELTESIPKALVKIGDESILEHIVGTFNSCGINRLSVVRGYRKETMTLPNIDYVDNDDYETTGELYSLYLALEALADSGEDLIISYGDILFKRYTLEALMDAEEDFVVAVDTGWRDSANRDRSADYVTCSMPNVRRAYYEPVELLHVAEDMDDADIHGEWMGILKVRAAGQPLLRQIVSDMIRQNDGSGREMKLPQLLNALIERDSVIRAIYTAGHWLDVDSVEDVVASSNFG
jgi:phosphoenolpyruvate phosphomutase